MKSGAARDEERIPADLIEGLSARRYDGGHDGICLRVEEPG